MTTLTPAQARVVNNCAAWLTKSRLESLGVRWGTLRGHPAVAANVERTLEAWA